MRKNLMATGAVAGALLLGSAGAALILPTLVSAADPSASAAAAPAASGAPSSDGGQRGPGGSGHFGGTTEAVTDTSVAAKALGMSESDLVTALQSGKSMADVAKAKGVDVQAVIDALVQDKKDEIAAAVKAGTMTQAEADQQLAGVTQFATDQVNRAGFGRGGHGQGGPGDRGFGGRNEAVSDTSVAAKAIGISESDLTTALQGGQTIAAVAKAHSVDVQTVIDALVADGKDELAAAVKAGTMTQAQADQETANLTARVTAQVNGTGFGPGGHGPGGRPNDNDADDAPGATPSASTGTSS